MEVPNHVFVQRDPPVRAFYLANAGGGGPVNLVLLGGGKESRCQQPLLKVAVSVGLFVIASAVHRRTAWCVIVKVAGESQVHRWSLGSHSRARSSSYFAGSLQSSIRPRRSDAAFVRRAELP